MKHNILITSAGQRVSLVRAFQKELSIINDSSKVYTADFNPEMAPACHVSDGFFKITKVTDPDYISELLKLCISLDIKLIIPTIDTELMVLASNRSTFLKNGIIPIVSSSDFVEKCRDKRLINIFFKQHNISIPHVFEKDRLSFPLFIKPYDGSLSKDTFLVEKPEDLTPYQLSNPKLMFMEYVDPSIFEEYTVDTYYDKNGKLKCAVPRKRIFVRAGEINKGLTRKNEIITAIFENLCFIDGAVGCLTMQFFFNPLTKVILGIEINPRFGGGYPLSYLAGANYPKYLLEEHILGNEIAYTDSWEDNLLMLRYDDEILVRNYEA